MYAADFDRATHTAVTVGSTTTAIIAANVNRRYLMLQNISDEAVYIKLGVAAVASEGIRLNTVGVLGDTFVLCNENGNLYKGAINGICASGSKVVLVTEGA